MKVLIASVPALDHLNPLLAIGRILIAEGHEVIGLSGSHLRARIESIGAEFRPLPAGADVDPADINAAVPELKSLPPSSEWLRAAMERVFLDNIPAHHEGLQKVLRHFPADIVIADGILFRAPRMSASIW
jgi:UDP:flavonoid glycosyltransferase YjiC (YdhE family)